MLDELECLLDITLPFPPSLNAYYKNWRGRTVLSPEGRAYKDVVLSHYLPIKNGRKAIDERLFTHLDYYPPDKRKRDMDNYEKGLWDSLQYAQAIKDDCLLKEKWIRWLDTLDERRGTCRVRLYPLGVVEVHIRNRSIERNMTNARTVII